MKKILSIALLAVSFASCTERFNSDYQSRLAGVKKVCPTCIVNTANHNSTEYYAIDTAKQPNLVYIVVFCDGFIYSTSTVHHLIKIN